MTRAGFLWWLLHMADNDEEENEALLEQAIKMSLSRENEDQGGELNSPFTPKPKDHSGTWEGPTTLFLGQLEEMGFSKNASIKGLYYTQNKCVDEAALWILNHSHLEDIDQPLESRLPAAIHHVQNWCILETQNKIASALILIQIGAQPDLEVLVPDKTEHRSPCKMVFVVNTELNMGVGKIAAQVGHATVSLYRKMLADQDNLIHIILQWEDHGEMKVVVKGNNVAHLMDLENQAKKEQLKTYLVYDAGRTQIAAGSVTVLGIFGTTDAVDKITGTLKLL